MVAVKCGEFGLTPPNVCRIARYRIHTGNAILHVAKMGSNVNAPKRGRAANATKQGRNREKGRKGKPTENGTAGVKPMEMGTAMVDALEKGPMGALSLSLLMFRTVICCGVPFLCHY